MDKCPRCKKPNHTGFTLCENCYYELKIDEPAGLDELINADYNERLRFGFAMLYAGEHPEVLENLLERN